MLTFQRNDNGYWHENIFLCVDKIKEIFGVDAESITMSKVDEGGVLVQPTLLDEVIEVNGRFVHVDRSVRELLRGQLPMRIVCKDVTSSKS